MPRFFVPALESQTLITGDDARHISRSLRMKTGDGIVLCDGRGMEAAGSILSITDDCVTVGLADPVKSAAEPSVRVSVYIALPKGDKAELVVQKCVELGAYELALVMTERCVSRPDERAAQKKLERLNRIAAEAAGQCGRGIIPRVHGILSFDGAIERMTKSDMAFLLYEGECPPLRGELSGSFGTISIMTGSEGGFSKGEVDLALRGGVRPVSLGRRILRCETAPIAALSGIMFYTGEMD